MRFASMTSNGRNYAAAGKAVADSAAKTFAVQRKTGPDYGKLSQVAMKTAAEEKITGMQAAAKVTNAGIDAYTKVTNSGHKIAVANNESDIKAKQKMAGGIAAIGKMVGVGVLSKDNEEGRTRPRADSTSIYEDYKNKRDQLTSDYEDSIKAVDDQAPGNSNGNPSTASTSSTPGNPKATGGFNLSKVIRYAEGTSGANGYNTMFTGSQFDDTTVHPRQINSGGGFSSDAAGAYQFLSTTWDGAKKALNLPDFSPASQELAGEYLAQQRGVDTKRVYTNINDFKADIDKLAPEWASLPTAATGTSYYGQGGKSIEDLWRVYQGG